jgi:1,4-alpha-glucan branching enzyme
VARTRPTSCRRRCSWRPAGVHVALHPGSNAGRQLRNLRAGVRALCNEPFKAGGEEYLDSEKYELKQWKLDAPDSLQPLIARVNAIRRENPALQSNDWLAFHRTDNSQMLAYSKRTPERENFILAVVNLDPHHAQEGRTALDLRELGIEDKDTFQVHDLLTGARYLWRGAENFVRLDPQHIPAAVFPSEPARTLRAGLRLLHVTMLPDAATEAPWYRNAVIYQAHVRSFYDSDGNGIGDLRGVTQKLDYLQDLGISALWLLPFYPSPLRDDGYDIADYYAINPIYGTLDDFKEFLDEAHRRSLRVITELVINHTSDQHPGFSGRGGPSPEASSAITTCGAKPRTSTATLGSSFVTSSNRIGRGTRLRARTSGIVSIRTSRI